MTHFYRPPDLTLSVRNRTRSSISNTLLSKMITRSSARKRKLRSPRQQQQNRAQPQGSRATLEIETPSRLIVSTDFPSPQTTENGNAPASPSDDCLSNITVAVSSDEPDRSESSNLGHEQTTHSRKRDLPDDAEDTSEVSIELIPQKKKKNQKRL